MLHSTVFAAVTAAAVVAPVPADTLSTFVAPGGLGLTLVGGLYMTAREYAKGRRERVAESEARAAREKKRADDAEEERDEDVRALRAEVVELHEQIKALQQSVTRAREDFRVMFEEQEARHREENRTQESRHRDEMQAMHSRLERESMEAWRLRQLCTRNGVDPDTGEAIGKVREDEHGAAGAGTG